MLVRGCDACLFGVKNVANEASNTASVVRPNYAMLSDKAVWFGSLHKPPIKKVLSTEETALCVKAPTPVRAQTPLRQLLGIYANWTPRHGFSVIFVEPSRVALVWDGAELQRLAPRPLSPRRR